VIDRAVGLAALALAAGLVPTAQGAALRSAAPCPAASRNAVTGYRHPLTEILAALRKEVPRVLHLTNQRGPVDLSKPGAYEVGAFARLGNPSSAGTKPRAISVHRCGERVTDVSWFVEIAVPEAAAADLGTFWLYVIHTKHGWHVWYVYCPYC
jgi:hypothetical protein